MTAHIKTNEANVVLSIKGDKMSDLRNKILNDLRDESLKICKELSSIKDTTKKAELIKIWLC